MNPQSGPPGDDRPDAKAGRRGAKSKAGSGSGKRVKNNLVALGTAAVLTAYTAGYARTRAAAARFEGEDAERRPAAPAVGGGAGNADASQRAADAVAADSQSAAATDRTAQPGQPGARDVAAASPVGSPARDITTQPAVTGANQPTTSASATAAPATGAPNASPASARVADSVPVPVPATPAVVTPPAAATTSAAQTADSVAQAADSVAQAAQAADKPRAMWRDGVYSGYGTSRHGDIEATVEIRGGRIVSAYISACLTRYPCSRISRLPPQVVARQSADVDFVSGATQSTNAFYYAVYEALTKAK